MILGSAAYYNLNDQGCSIGCGLMEDLDHLFVKYDFYGRLRYLVASWLGFSTTTHDNLHGYLRKVQFLTSVSVHLRKVQFLTSVSGLDYFE